MSVSDSEYSSDDDIPINMLPKQRKPSNDENDNDNDENNNEENNNNDNNNNTETHSKPESSIAGTNDTKLLGLDDPCESIAKFLKAMNLAYGAPEKVITEKEIEKVLEAGYSVRELMDVLEGGIVGQQGFLRSIGCDDGAMIKVHRIIKYYGLVCDTINDDPLRNVPIKIKMNLLCAVFNLILCIIGDWESGELRIKIGYILQRKMYRPIAAIKTAKTVRDEAIEALSNKGFVYTTAVVDEENEEEKDEEKEDEKQEILDEDIDKKDEKKKKKKKKKKKHKKKKKKKEKKKKKKKKKAAKKSGKHGGSRYATFVYHVRAPSEVVKIFIADGEGVDGFTKYVDHNRIDLETWGRKRGGNDEIAELERLGVFE